MLKKSVVIATPDAMQRNRLAHLVDRMPEFEVITRTADLMNTYNEVEERMPKAVLIADVLARLPEFEVMRALFATLDVRWLVVMTTRANTRPEVSVQDFRPGGSDLFSIPADAPEDLFYRQLCSLTRTPRNQQPLAKRHVPPTPIRPVQSIPRQETFVQKRPVQATAPPPPAPLATAGRQDRLILIGASTGGVDALLTVLSRFPRSCPPTLVVQHTGTGFGESLAGLLNRQCLPEVRLASGPITLRPGQIVIGAGTKSHLIVEAGSTLRATTEQTDPVSGHVPSVDMLFHSAVHLAHRVSAAILTGMGRDGANGMKALYDAGAFTVAQDESTSVVYGMPRAAVESNAICKILPLDQIGSALLFDHQHNRRGGRELQR